MARLKGKVIRMGDKGIVRGKRLANESFEYAYDQPYSYELGISENTIVTFDLVNVGDKQVAVAVNPVEKGTIVEIDYEKGTGTILETESGIKYPFSQNFLKESKFEKEQVVKYTLVMAKDTITAVCLVAI